MAPQRRDLRSAVLNLIRDAGDLLQEETTILASVEECDYFRSIYRSSRDPSIQKNSAAPEKPILKACISENAIKPSEPPLKTLAEPIRPTIEPLSAPLPTPSAPPPKASPPDMREVPPVSTPFSADEGFDIIRKLLSKISPELVLLSEIPSDAKARQIAQRWKTKNQSAPISLLFLHEPLQQQKFLANLITALDVVFGSARLINAEGIEKDGQWEAFLSVSELKLVIICDYALWQMPHLLKFYREVPNQTQRFLLNKALMLLPDLTLYLKDPQLKRSLWKALCQKIGSL